MHYVGPNLSAVHETDQASCSRTISTESIIRAFLQDTHKFCFPIPFEVAPPVAYLVFPQLKGTYRCFIMCIICCFICMKKRARKYINKAGQNTGISKAVKNVI